MDERGRRLAALIGADAKEIVFTSGATEANNLALKGLVEVAAPARRHIVTVATEHKSVLDTCRALQRHGCETTVLGGSAATGGSISIGCAPRSPNGRLRSA